MGDTLTKSGKRYGYDWANLWLINTHNGIKGKLSRIHIEDYPAVKTHLDQYWDKISKRADKGDTPYNLRNCAYLEDFNQPKMLYPDIMRLPRSKEKMNLYPYFVIDKKQCIPEATLFMMTGKSINLICSFLCSQIGFFVFTKFYMGPVFDDTGFRYKKEYLLNLPVPYVENQSSAAYDDVLSSALGLTEDEKKLIFSYKDTLLFEDK